MAERGWIGSTLCQNLIGSFSWCKMLLVWLYAAIIPDCMGDTSMETPALQLGQCLRTPSHAEP